MELRAGALGGADFSGEQGVVGRGRCGQHVKWNGASTNSLFHLDFYSSSIHPYIPTLLRK